MSFAESIHNNPSIYISPQNCSDPPQYTLKDQNYPPKTDPEENIETTNNEIHNLAELREKSPNEISNIDQVLDDTKIEPHSHYPNSSKKRLSPNSKNDKRIKGNTPLHEPTFCGKKINYYLYPGSQIPVFMPDEEQFEDFQGFIAAIDEFGVDAGLAKVIPPKSWRQELERKIRDDFNKKNKAEVSKKSERINIQQKVDTDLENNDSNVTIFANKDFPEFRPIVQHFDGGRGNFRQYNIEYFYKNMNLARFFHLSEQPGKCLSAIGSDRSQIKPIPTKNNEIQNGKTQSSDHSIDTNENLNQIDKTENQNDTTSKEPGSNIEGIVVDYKAGTIQLTSKSVYLDNSQPQDKKKFIVKNPTLKYRGIDQITPESAYVNDEILEYNHEVERTYWKNLLIEAPMYGADVSGTIFPSAEEFPNWNIRDLGTILNKVKVGISGVTLPYLYIGTWKATFAWHLEDMDLFSINYVHFGAPKSWFSIPKSSYKRFERCCQGVFADEYKKCKEFMRHKTFHLSPSYLATQGINVNRVVQNAGEFIITFPYGYHAGFNHGFNCAESTNFALGRWVDIGRKASFCKCIPDSVKIDVNSWYGADENSVAIQNTQENSSIIKKTHPKKKRKTSSQNSKRTSNSFTSDLLESKEDTKQKDMSKTLIIPDDVMACCYKPKLFEEEIIQCSDCKMNLHKGCLGSFINNFKTGDPLAPFKCMSCKNPEENISCMFCMFSGGLLLPTSNPNKKVRRSSRRISQNKTPPQCAHLHCIRFIHNIDINIPENIMIEKLESGDTDDKIKPEILQENSLVPGDLNNDISVNDLLPPKNNGSFTVIVESIKNNIKSPLSNPCTICTYKRKGISGAFVECGFEGCKKLIHPTCALIKFLELGGHTETGKNKTQSDLQASENKMMEPEYKINWDETKIFCSVEHSCSTIQNMDLE
ncbi:hypothetical protein BB559_007209 [Furculomyces boomerangus]|uniref:[Histone H3]-trimethyl-L-lysine(9) demethylase n=1 Tax=Furculomyces boomerangus TaxID=61424 RepID=A0A2T9XYF3_9FUNG|nr:hypothetical protein BB559_007209 [Furculomyces boomerangus]